MEEDDNFQSLSLDDRLSHKLWKARLSAYEELTRLFKTLSPKDAIFRDRIDDMRRAPLESNAACLDVALMALLAYIEACETVSRLRPLILSNLIEKGLGATRTSTKARSLDILLELVAGDGMEPVIVLKAIKSIMRLNFGVNAINVKVIVKFIPKIFQHSDKNVRSEGVSLVLELARWIGPAVNVCFDNLKPVQVKELQDLISKLPAESPRPKRQKKSDRPESSGLPMEIDLSTEHKEASTGSMSDIIDSYALSDPINILEKIPESVYTNGESSQWKQRKEALESILAVLKVPKIEDGQFGPLTNLIVKKIGDVNISVVIVAAHCIEALALGLRKGFSPYRSEVISALLDRCKERNKAVLEALRLALDAMVHCIPGVTEIIESHGCFLKHKNPQVKTEAVAWIDRCLPKVLKPTQGKKELRLIIETLISLMDDGSAEVREATSLMLSSLVKIAGEKQVVPLLEKLDKVKINKILEAVVASSPVQSNPVVVAKIPPVTSHVVNTSSRTSTVGSLGESAAQSISDTRTQITDNIRSRAELVFAHNDEESVLIVGTMVGDHTVALISDANWKVRLGAIDKIVNQIEAIVSSSTNLNSELLVRFFSIKPGWKESNFQVLNRVVVALTTFAEKHSFTVEATTILIPGIIDKISDPKIGIGVGILFTAIADKIGLGPMISCMSESLKNFKNPKVTTEGLSWIATALLDFGTGGVDIPMIVKVVKGGICNPNVIVRSAALKVAINLRRCIGADAKLFFLELPSAQQSILDMEFAKVSLDPIPVPIRSKVVEPPLNNCENDKALTNSQSTKNAHSEDLKSRHDITNELNALVPELDDNNWKVRKEAMDKAVSLITKAGNRIKLSNYDFLSELKTRLTDSNKNLIVQALELSALLANSIGTAFEKHVKIVLSPALACLADNKPQVRQSSLKFLSAAIANSTLASMTSILASSLATDSPNLRRELLTWLFQNASTLGTIVSDDDRIDLITATMNCLQDRTAEVRKAASLFLDSVLNVVPGETLLHLCQGSRQVLLPAIKQIVDAHKPLVNSDVPTLIPKTPQKQSVISNRTPKKGMSNHEEIIGQQVFLNRDIQSKSLRWEQDSRSGLKWQFEQPRVEFDEYLKGQMQSSLSISIIQQLFSDDFKDITSAIAIIDEVIQTGREHEGILANLDLILKYTTIRLFDTSPSTLLKTFELIEHVLAVIDEANLRLTEAEALAFLPHFVQRAGEFKEPIRGKVRSIYRQLCRVYPASKIFIFLLEGLRCKTSSSRVEALSEMRLLVTRNGLMVIQAAKHIPFIAGAISDKDTRVRNAALNLLAQVYDLLGESIYKHLTNVPAKELEMFHERLRHRQADEHSEVEEEGQKDEENIIRVIEKVNDPSGPPQVFALDPEIVRTATVQIDPLVNTPAAPRIDKFAIMETPTIDPFPNYFVSAPAEDPLDIIIQQIANEPDMGCISALQRLDEYMSDPIGTLLPKIVPLITSLTTRLHECMTFPNVFAVDLGLKSRLCRYVTNALVLISTDVTCINHVDDTSLNLLIREIVNSLLSGNLGTFQDRDQLSRALNILLVKILDNVKRNSSYRILLQMLEAAFHCPPSVEDRYPEMIMKCLWKITKQLPNDIQNKEVDVTSLLVDVDHFLSYLPPMEWKARTVQQLPFGDLPYRTVKTILHEAVTTMGDRVIHIVRSLPGTRQSFVTSYVRAMLTANGVDASGLNFDQQLNTTELAQVTKSPIDASALEEELRDICSKVCSKPNTRAGLAELYELEKRYPQAGNQIDAYLQTLGSFFYKYIRRNLAQIESEANRNGFEIEAHKHRIAQIQGVFRAGGMVSEDTVSPTDCISTGSPIRNRLDSPAAKSALKSSSKTTQLKDSTIVNLKERLAKLRHGEQ